MHVQASRKQVRAVVIGAGIIGCSAAYFLARFGVQVVIVDAGGIGSQGSGVNAGTLAVQNKTGVLLQLALRSVNLWQELAQSYGLSAEYLRSGGLRVAIDSAEAAELERQVERQQALGLPVELLTAQQLQNRFSERFGEVKAATFCPVDGYANPRLATLSLAKLAQGHGAQFMPYTPVTGLEAVSDTQIKVIAQERTGKKWEIESNFVINAAGVWAPYIANMLGYTVPLHLKVQQAMVTVKTAQILTKAITHVGERLSLKQMRDGNLLIGGGWPGKTDTMKQEREVLLDSMLQNLQLAVKVLPAIQHLQLLRTWCGLEAETTDRLPLLGSMGYPSHFIAAVSGYGGFTVGPFIGKLIAERIALDQQPALYAKCDPARLMNDAEAVK